MLKFILVDYTFSPLTPISTEVEEPIGWELVSLRIKRDFSWHGHFDFWDDSLNQLKWHGLAMQILNGAYDVDGIEAQVELKIQYVCAEDGSFNTLYQGRFNFTRFLHTCTDWCFVECGVENLNCFMSLKNRFDQTVNIDTLTSFDSSTEDLVPYKWLDALITLPQKPIHLSNEWEISNDTISYVDTILDSETIGTQANYFFSFDWTKDTITEISTSNREKQWHGGLTSAPGEIIDEFSELPQIVELDLGNQILCSGLIKVELEMSGMIGVLSSDSMNFNGSIIIRWGNHLKGWSYNVLDSSFGCVSCNDSTTPISIHTSLSISASSGDKIELYFVMAGFSYSTGGGGGTPSDPFELSLHIDNASLKITVDSTCAPTPAKVYMINEVLSRLAEAYTGDCLRVYSDYFGRVDAQPYPSAVNGCGALACITSGLKIRTKDQGFIRIGDSEFTPGFTLSMRECFDALNAIHNIGMGIEPDLVRNDGSDWLRIEPMEYFYRDDVLLTCTGIRELRREFDPTKAFDRATIGYSNWETESVNGLNDVFGKREYRTSLKQLRNLYERLCPFIASDYAIEITRRQYGNTTKDWRYDNDTFIICLRSGSLGTARFQGPHTISVNGDFTDTLQAGDSITISGSGFNNGTFTLASFSFDGAATDMVMVEAVVSEVGSSGVLVVDETHPFYTVEQNAIETGGSTANIMYPEYCYNLRITPARNALRHTKTLMSGYGNNWADKQVLFSAGDGNYVAILDLKENDCTIEQDGALLENGNISVDTVIDENGIKPIYTAERVTFEYPVNYEQYKTIKANPYGLIGYQCGGGDVQYGYIEDFSYKPAQGIAEFTLRPKL